MLLHFCLRLGIWEICLETQIVNKMGEREQAIALNLPDYAEEEEESDDDSDEDEEEMQRVSEVWTLEQEFGSADELKEYVRDQATWCISRSNLLTAEGHKTFYYCNIVSKKNNAQGCPAKIYTVSSATEVKFSVFKNNVDHDHENKVLSKRVTAIRYEFLNRVKEYLRLGVKPRAISHELRFDVTIENKPTEKEVNKIKPLFYI